MGYISYIFRRLGDMHYDKLAEMTKYISEKTGRSRLGVLLDMGICAVRYGAGYADYELYEMYAMTPAQRNTVMTRGRNNAFVKKYNQKDYFHCLENKDEFNTIFADFLGRSWVYASADTREQARQWINENSHFIAKPRDGGGGRGVEIIDMAEQESVDAVLDRLTADGRSYVLEQLIKQCAEFNRLYPYSVNTVRFLTIQKDGKVACPAAYLRIGSGGHVVDNFHQEGLAAPIDMATGRVRSVAVDRRKQTFTKHPVTGTEILGYQVPQWPQIVAMCRRAALIVPQMSFTGWDVAVTDAGPVFIEANEFPGHDIYQLPEHTPDKIGMYPVFMNAKFE